MSRHRGPMKYATNRYDHLTANLELIKCFFFHFHQHAEVYNIHMDHMIQSDIRTSGVITRKGSYNKKNRKFKKKRVRRK